MAEAGNRRSKESARDVARRVLARVDEGAYATLSLDGELRRSALPERDRALVTELVYGVLRQRLRLDRALLAYAPRGLNRLDGVTRDVLRVCAYQLLFLRTPAHAAVDDAVGALRRLRGDKLAGFANAILRRLAAEGEPALAAGPWDPQALSLSLSLPPFVVKDALRRFGPEEGPRFLAALNLPAPTWLRLNLLRGDRELALSALSAEVKDGSLQPSPRLPEAVRISGVNLFRGAAYEKGWFTAQDLAAQLVGRLACATPLAPGPLLDACAGAGGKTTHLSQLLANRAEIDAADQSERKLALCREHAERLGCAHVRTIACDLSTPGAPLRPAYALVLLDAPCTGLGVLRRHPEARWRLQPEQIGALAAQQEQLLRTLAKRVQPGGLLVYSVCSYMDEEGPAQVAALLAREPAFTIEPPPPSDLLFKGLIDETGALRSWPHRDDADAFYAVRLRRLA